MKMRLFVVDAAVNKYLLLFLICFASSCGLSHQSMELSNTFDICANMPREARVNIIEGPDFERGVVEIDAKKVDFYIGGHPNIPHKIMKKAKKIEDEFVYLGEEDDGESEKLLWAIRGSDIKGPVFVMFSSEKFGPEKKWLTDYNFLYKCSGD
jgi:hypothetical protein